jgi:hypothetical protein
VKFKIRKTSDWDFRSEVELSTLEELVEWCNKNGYEIILNTADELELEIYDGYRE